MVTLIWPDGQVQERHVQYLLDKTFFCNSCLSNEANAHSPPYTATLLGEIICNVKTGKGEIKKKECLLVLKILLTYTYSVHHIQDFYHVIQNIKSRLMYIRMSDNDWCALNFHLILLGSTISQKDKENNKQKINGITGWRHCDEYIRQVAWHLTMEGVQATDWHKHMYLGLSICPKLYENQPLDIHSCQKKLVRNSWQLICTS